MLIAYHLVCSELINNVAPLVQPNISMMAWPKATITPEMKSLVDGLDLLPSDLDLVVK